MGIIIGNIAHTVNHLMEMEVIVLIALQEQ